MVACNEGGIGMQECYRYYQKQVSLVKALNRIYSQYAFIQSVCCVHVIVSSLSGAAQSDSASSQLLRRCKLSGLSSHSIGIDYFLLLSGRFTGIYPAICSLSDARLRARGC